MMKALTKKRGFPFRNAVALLDAAETVERRARHRKTNSKNQKTAIERERKNELEATIEAWFVYNKDLLAERLENPVALFSILFPKDRTDRVYNYQPPKLYKALAKWLGISPGRTECLEPGKWTLRFDDFGAALEDVMRVAENPETEVTCEEVDAVLDVVAGKSRFSSKRVRGKGTDLSVDEALGGLLRRLSSLEAKWLMRVVLKETRVVELPVSFTLGRYHFLLPHIYTIQHDLTFAFQALDDELLSCLPAHPPPEKFGKYLLSATRQIKPIVGIQIQLPEFWKARSVRHAAKLVGGRQVYMERKYDGEYCQVHIDLKKPWKERITIFSKSGRDSTEDRKGLHTAVEQGLRLNNGGKKIEKCILEGEMFVYNEVEKCYMDFSEIRKHVTRAGIMLGTDYDEKPDYTTQHLMVVFFDVLYHDGVSYLDRPLHERKSLLEKLVTPIEGLCELPYNRLLNLAGHEEEYCTNYINAEFKKGIANRFEGYILKPYDAPYIGFGLKGNPHHWVKLKKDYIPGLGDTLDACIIGATHEPGRGLEMNVDPSVMTSYFIGFVKDKETVKRTGERRIFVVVDVIAHCLPPHIQKLWNERFRASGINYYKGETSESINYDLEIREGIPTIQKLLPEPIVAEIIGGSFHKPSNFCHYILRWPRLVKFKSELSWADAMDFESLQEAAYEAMSAPEGAQMAEEERAWEARLEQSLMTKKRKIAEAVPEPPPFPKRDLSSDANIAKLRMAANRSVGSAGWRFWDQTGDIGDQSQNSCQSTQDMDTEDSPRMAYLELMEYRDEKPQGQVSDATSTGSRLVDIAIRESQQEVIQESVSGGGNSTATVTIYGPSEREDEDTIKVVGTSDPLPPTLRPNRFDSERAEQVSAINSHLQASLSNEKESERASKATAPAARKYEPYPLPPSHKPPPEREDDDDLQILSYRKVHSAKPLPAPPRLLKGLSHPRSIRSTISRRVNSPKSPPLIIDLSADEPYPTPPNTSPPATMAPSPFHHAQIILGTHLSRIPHLASLLLPHAPHTITPLSTFLSIPNFDKNASRTILLIDQRMVDPMRGDIRELKKVVEEENLAAGGLGRVAVGIYCWRGLESDGRRGWGEWERGSIP